MRPHCFEAVRAITVNRVSQKVIPFSLSNNAVKNKSMQIIFRKKIPVCLLINPRHLRNVTTLPCEMQTSFIWSNWYCSPENGNFVKQLWLCRRPMKRWISDMQHDRKVKVKFSHTRYRPLGPELIPVYRQSARRWLRWREVNHAIDLAVGCHYFLPGLRLPP